MKNRKLEILNGIPFFSFVPQHIARAGEFKQLNGQAKAVEDWFLAHHSQAAPEFERACDGLESSGIPVVKLQYGELTPRTSLMPAIALVSSSSRLSVKALEQVHSALVGPECTGVRSIPVWMGAPHPAKAWYVAPSPSYIPGLLSDLCEFATDRRHCALLRASVTLLQLLLIHPFADGNGRLSRALFLGIAAREITPHPVWPQALRLLWRHRGTHLHRASLFVRDEDDWSEYVNLFLGAVREAATPVEK